MKVVIGITGASGAVYAKRLLDLLSEQKVDLSVVASVNAKMIFEEECGLSLEKAPGQLFENDDFSAPFLSGSNLFDAMVIVPCSMGSLGRVASGISESVISRAADVFLKEKRKLILVPRETPLNLIHTENMSLLLKAGATLIPAMPSFYSHPKSIEELVDTVVCRILDHLGLDGINKARWKS